MHSLTAVGKSKTHLGLYFGFGHGHFGLTGSPGNGKLLAAHEWREALLGLRSLRAETADARPLL